MNLRQLTLRELFLLVALAAMGCGWWVRERDWGSKYNVARNRFFTAEQIASLWEGRANSLAEKMTADGYKVTWAGTPASSTLEIYPPEVIQDQYRLKQEREGD